MKWMVYATYIGEKNANILFVGKPQYKKPFRGHK
jgi:hypothetical protein